MQFKLEVSEYSPMRRRRLWLSPIGNMQGIYFNPSGTPLCTLGPQYLYFFLSFTILLLIQGLFLVCAFHLLTLAMKFSIFFTFLISLASFTFAGLVNPGINLDHVLKEQEILSMFNSKKFCRVCEVIREPGCLHCPECDLCINSRRFHSIMIGKCVGSRNVFSYYLSIICLVATFLQIVLAVIINLK